MLVEKVARAIARNKRGPLTTDADIDRVATAYMGQARAAIEAVFDWLGEPTKQAVSDGIDAIEEAVDWSQDTECSYICSSSSDYAMPGYKAMLAAMRKEALP